MKVIAGLGNPGKEYERTPHNVGFDVVDRLAARLGEGWRNSPKFHALTVRTAFAGETVLLVKPQTFMNLSGTSIGPLLKYFGGKPADLTVVVDDVNLPLGKLRIRAAGSCGGHNGLASVIQCLGTDAFTRIRLGMGRQAHGSLVDHVLGRFDEERQKVVSALEEASADAVELLIRNGLNEVMNRYNGWRVEETPGSDRK